MKIVLFEGVDKSGKTTLARAFNKATKHKHLVIDRLFLSQYAYSLSHNRHIDLQDLDRIFYWMKPDLIIVYVCADKKLIERRLSISNHEKIDLERDLSSFDKAIEKFDKMGADIIVVDTSFLQPKTNVKIVTDYIQKLELSE